MLAFGLGLLIGVAAAIGVVLIIAVIAIGGWMNNGSH